MVAIPVVLWHSCPAYMPVNPHQPGPPWLDADPYETHGYQFWYPFHTPPLCRTRGTTSIAIAENTGMGCSPPYRLRLPGSRAMIGPWRTSGDDCPSPPASERCLSNEDTA